MLLNDPHLIFINIKPYKNNPRNNDQAVEKVLNSIKEFGFKNPIIIDENKIIINGHTRLKAAQKLSLKEVISQAQVNSIVSKQIENRFQNA